MTITLPEYAAWLILGALVGNAILSVVLLYYRIRIKRLREKANEA